MDIKDAADTITLIRDTLGKQKLVSLRAQKDLLRSSLVPIKQLILEKSPSCVNELDWDEWSGALWELYVTAVSQTVCGQSCVEATEEQHWQEVVEATLGETQDDVETFLPVWWTERTMFSFLLLFIGFAASVLSQSLSWSGRTSFILLVAGFGIMVLSQAWSCWGVEALEFHTIVDR